MNALSNICSFCDRVALVTGAGGNIGRSIVRMLAAHGVKVAAADIRKPDVERLFPDELGSGAAMRPYEMDVTDDASVAAAVSAAIDDFGHIDIMVNNAGVWEHRGTPGCHRFETVPPDEWRRLLDIDVGGVMRGMQAVLPHMLERGYGRIVNLGSIAGLVGKPGYSDYSAAKAAIIMLTKTVAMENAKRGVTVNSVSPGMVAAGEVKRTPGTWIGREGTADEMARAVVFLAADESGFITGVDIPVDGGRVLGPHGDDM